MWQDQPRLSKIGRRKMTWALFPYCAYAIATLSYCSESMAQNGRDIETLAYSDWNTVYDAPGGRKIEASVYLRGDSGYYILKKSGARGILSDITYYKLFEHNQVINLRDSPPTPAVAGIFNLNGATGFFVFRAPNASGRMDGYSGSWVTDNRRIYLAYGGSWDGNLVATHNPSTISKEPQPKIEPAVATQDAPNQPVRNEDLRRELNDLQKTVHTQTDVLRIAAIETAALRRAFEKLAAGGSVETKAPSPDEYKTLPPLPKDSGLEGANDPHLSGDYLRRFNKSCQFVCRILANIDFVHPVLGRQSKGGGIGTAILVGPSLVLTCNHVVPTDDVARSVGIQFTNGDQKVDFELAATATVQSSPVDKLDYSLLRVAIKNGEPPGATFNHYYLETSATHRNQLLFEDLRVNLIHYPDGRETQAYEIRGLTLKLQSDSFVAYDVHTARGSSGAPVFNDYWWLIAIHKGKFDATANERVRGKGIAITAIIDDLRKNASQQLLQELHLTNK